MQKLYQFDEVHKDKDLTVLYDKKNDVFRIVNSAAGSIVTFVHPNAIEDIKAYLDLSIPMFVDTLEGKSSVEFRLRCFWFNFIHHKYNIHYYEEKDDGYYLQVHTQEPLFVIERIEK